MKEDSFHRAAGFDPSLHYLRPKAPELTPGVRYSVALLW